MTRSRLARSHLLPLLLAIALTAVPSARAERAVISTQAVRAMDVPGGQIEGACGIATLAGRIYVSDYYSHAIDVFTSGGDFLERIPTDPLDSTCQLAAAPDGSLYANHWHQDAARILPAESIVDSAESTGVAVDQSSGDVYVNDRDHIAVYDASGEPVLEEGVPLTIGAGTLGDGYGIAVDAGRVYVPDASDQTVKVYEASVDPAAPVATIDGSATPLQRFNSLTDAAVAVDPDSGHLVVIDNLQPGYEHPAAALYEFDAGGAFLGSVATPIVDGEPSGLAFSGANLLVTSGNDEGSTVLQLGPYFNGPGQAGATAPVTASVETLGASPLPIPASSKQSSAEEEPGKVSLRLRTLGSSAGKAAARAEVSVPGRLWVRGRWLRRSKAQRVGPGSHLLRLGLNRRGFRALHRSNLHGLRVVATVGFRPQAGGREIRLRRTLIFKRGQRER